MWAEALAQTGGSLTAEFPQLLPVARAAQQFVEGVADERDAPVGGVAPR